MTAPSGQPIQSLPPRCVRTHYEIRSVQNGRATLLRDCEDTLNQAREAAEWKCRALGFEKCFELDAGESFADAMSQDGIYIVAVQTETFARAI
jgi:hypothetical protein